jgi:RimJ/RimL family protein N-acetyltransferase
MLPLVRFPIETDRLLIRPMRPDDAEDLHEVYSDVETMAYLTSEIPRVVDDTRAWMAPKVAQQERYGISLWSVVERASGKVIGDCGLQTEDETLSEVELGFRFNRRYWGRGYALEACAACVAVAFDQLGLQRLVAGTDRDNARGRRLLERLGMRHVREGVWFGRKMAEYEISAAEWARTRRRGT